MGHPYGHSQVPYIAGVYTSPMSLVDVLTAFPKQRSSRTKTKRPLEQRLWEKITKTDTCWVWTGGRDPAGYGTFCVNRSNRRAHTVVYLLVRGRYPSHCVLDHLCHFSSCVNPDHLEPVSCEESTKRAIAYLKAGGLRRTAPISQEEHNSLGTNCTP